MKLTKDQTQIIVLAVIVTVALFVGTIFVLVKPGVKEKSELKARLENLGVEIRKNSGIANKKSSIEKEMEEAKQQVSDFQKTIITVSEFEFFKDTLRDIGNEYNVKVLRERTNTVDDSRKSVFKENLKYTEKEISLSLSCKYHDLGSFLNRIENTSLFRKVIDFSINKNEQDNTLNVDLKILSLLVENNI